MNPTHWIFKLQSKFPLVKKDIFQPSNPMYQYHTQIVLTTKLNPQMDPMVSRNVKFAISNLPNPPLSLDIEKFIVETNPTSVLIVSRDSFNVPI